MAQFVNPVSFTRSRKVASYEQRGQADAHAVAKAVALLVPLVQGGVQRMILLSTDRRG